MQTLSSILVGLLLLALGGATIVFVSQAQAHVTLGTWSELAGPTLASIGIGVVGFAAAGLGAWALWSKELKMASQLLAIVAVVFPIAAWKTIDAANVVLDGSKPELHATEVVDKYERKSRTMLVVRSHRDPEATLELDLNALGTGHELALGQTATITIHAGAFGRPYATKIEAR